MWRSTGIAGLAYFFIYRRREGFSTHGREMYLGQPRTARVTGLSNAQRITGVLSGNEAAAQQNGGQIDPAIRGFFADKRQLFQ
jgi:hypothetical protein